MDPRELNRRIETRGRELFDAVRGETPSLFDRGRWLGQVVDWCLRHEEFRLQLFRFVDVFPALRDDASLVRHLEEYFGAEEELPAALRWSARSAGRAGRFGASLLSRLIRRNLREMGRQFIIGEDAREAVASLGRLRADGFAFTVDLLGEATVSEPEAESYLEGNLLLLDGLEAALDRWEPLPPATPGKSQDWGHAPVINLSAKPTGCYSQVRPQDFEGSAAGVLSRLEPLYARIRELGGFLCLDMETWQTKDLTLELYRRLRRAHPDYPHLGIAVQSYLRETDADLAALLAWAREEELPVSVRLVKGAYWDFEIVRARLNGWPSPVWENKAETDAAFERQARLLLENHDVCRLACGSHNLRSIAAVLETARALAVPEERYEFQVLYGMAEPVRRGLLREVGRVRLYAPFGELVPGMAYLVRRLLENTANTSFLRRSFAEEENPEELLADPAGRLPVEADGQEAPNGENGLPPFRNEPAANFARAEERDAFQEALAAVRGRLGATVPLWIGGADRTTGELRDSVNPAAPEEVIARVCQAGPGEAEEALEAAREAFPGWRDTPVRKRAGVLLRAAAGARDRSRELAAWQVLEIGKPWDQAHADVAEAIDFLEYYAREALRRSEPRPIGGLPGEENLRIFEPRGVAAVIAPWNFPLAISTGMSAAALAAGNCVVYKPSGLTPAVGRRLAELLRDAGLPEGVFNFLPGPGEAVGSFLVRHPRVDLVAFTGSMEVGLEILEQAAVRREGQEHVKGVVAEMGGKNAILVDDDADLDEAVPAVLQSAFGFQGQKCSACSRVIVLDAVHDAFVERLTAAAAALRVGPAEDPATFLGPLAEEAALEKVRRYVAIGREEGELLFEGKAPGVGGWYAPPVIFGAIRPEHRLAREEIFGPVLAVMRAVDFDQALAWANATPYALTGGIFSRSPSRLERARREFRVGDLYVNRGITGAMVGRQPFGGFGLSGTGTQAGGPDYLDRFLLPRVITENTLRRGFSPETLRGEKI